MWLVVLPCVITPLLFVFPLLVEPARSSGVPVEGVVRVAGFAPALCSGFYPGRLYLTAQSVELGLHTLASSLYTCSGVYLGVAPPRILLSYSARVLSYPLCE